MARLFGTDGIRGVANVDLKPTTAYALGRAVAHHLVGRGGALVVGQDTRRSGDMFVSSIAAGATSLGVDVHLVGVVPDAGARVPRRIRLVHGRDHGLRVAQSGRRQRAQGARPRRPQARRRDRGRARAADLADRGARRGRQRRDGPDRSTAGRSSTTTAGTGSGLAALDPGRRPAGRARLRQRLGLSGRAGHPGRDRRRGLRDPRRSRRHQHQRRAAAPPRPASLAEAVVGRRRRRRVRARRRRRPADRGRRGRPDRRRRPGARDPGARPARARDAAGRRARRLGPVQRRAAERASRRPAGRSSGRRSATSTSSRACRCRAPAWAARRAATSSSSSTPPRATGS